MIGSPIIFIAISVWVYKAYYRLNGSLREEVEENISLMQMKGNASSETGLT
jgi:hypothetical protein